MLMNERKAIEGMIVVAVAALLGLAWYLFVASKPAPAPAQPETAPVAQAAPLETSAPAPASSTASQPASAAAGLNPIQGLYTNPF